MFLTSKVQGVGLLPVLLKSMLKTIREGCTWCCVEAPILAGFLYPSDDEHRRPTEFQLARLPKDLMETTCTLASVIDQIRADDHDKWDDFVRPTDLAYSDGQIHLCDHDRPGRPGSLTPTNWALGQLCHQLSIPTSYFKRCPPQLQATQFDYWIGKRCEDNNEQLKWLIRAKDSVLRGVVSERFARLDNAQLLNALEPYLNDQFTVQWCASTETSLHLRLIRLDTRKLILVGDEACAGIHIANSEVGFRQVTIDPIIYRLVCTNGMVTQIKGKSLYHRRHIGSMVTLEPNRLEAAVGEALVVGTQSLDRFAASTTEIVEEPQALLATNAIQWQLSDELQEDILERLGYETPDQQHTRYGLVNAVTSAAQGKEPDERYRLETLAGHLLVRV